MNLFDKIINEINPRAALKRAKARLLLHATNNQLRKYEGATRGRRSDGWITSSGSANAEIKAARSLLVERSRDLTRNNPYTKRAVQLIANNTIGLGIRPAPAVGSPALDKKLKQAWKTWADDTTADFDGDLNFYGLQLLTFRTVVESGEALILHRRLNPDKDSAPFQLQVLEGDYLDAARDVDNITGEENKGGYISQGIEFDKDGRRVAYWLFRNYPGERLSNSSRRVPAAEVIHVFVKERAGQIRGVPFASAIITKLRDFDEYDDAQLVKQKIAACFAAFVTDNGDGADGLGGGADDATDFDTLEPGAVEILSPGKDIKFAEPPAADGYSEFRKGTLQAVAAGFGVTYEGLTSDLSNVNFSSGRMGWIEFQRNISVWQELVFIPKVCAVVWGWFVEALRVKGTIKSPDKIRASWTPPRREMIDPVKETKGMTDAVLSGFQSWSETVRERGFDPEEVLQQLAADLKKFDALGLKLAIDGRVALAKPGVPDAAESDEDRKPENK